MKKRLIQNIVLVAISVIIPLFVLECFLHITNLHSLIKRDVYPRYYFQADSENGFDIRPNQKPQKHTFFDLSYDIWSNNIGCFDSEYASVTPYIYLTGDSFTWGFTPFNDKWGTKIEETTGVRVLKCGVGGYGTKQEFVKTSRHLDLLSTPELILVGYLAGNDPDDDAHYPNNTVYDGYWVRNLAVNGVTEAEARTKYETYEKYCVLSNPENRFIQRARCMLNNNSIIYNLLKNNVRSFLIASLPQRVLLKLGLVVEPEITTNLSSVENDSNFKDHLDNFSKFKNLAANKKAKLLVILLPGDNKRQIEYLKQQSIDFLDLETEFLKYSKDIRNDFQWKVDGHWNIKGNHLAGYIVSKFLIEKNYVAIKESSTTMSVIDGLIKKEFPITKDSI